MTTTAAPATAPQIAYATDLRNNLAAQPAHYLDDIDAVMAAPLLDPSARLYRLARIVAGVEAGASSRRLRRLVSDNPAAAACIVEGGDNTPGAILRRLLDRRGDIAATTDADIAAMDRDQISTYIDAAKGLA